MEYSRSSSVIEEPSNFICIVEGTNRLAGINVRTQITKTLVVGATFPVNCSWVIHNERWLVVTGGKRGTQPLNEVLSLEIDPREISYLPELPEPVYDHCSLDWHDRLYVFGGYDTGLNAVFSYETGQWEVLNIQRRKGHKPYGCVHNEKIVIAPYYGSTTFEVLDPSSLEVTTFKVKIESPSMIATLGNSLAIFNAKVHTLDNELQLNPGFAVADKGLNLWSAGPVFQFSSKFYLLRWQGCKFVEVDLQAKKTSVISLDLRQVEPEPCALCPRKDCLTAAECNWSRRRSLLVTRKTL
mmetsp:Transcript_8334/g.16469  ORF Transcript_8334/g.16469 Transcript_8334/m.16469 type:complete len:297 (+) Transcript_8334:2532-3422(+)